MWDANRNTASQIQVIWKRNKISAFRNRARPVPMCKTYETVTLIVRLEKRCAVRNRNEILLSDYHMNAER